MKKISLVIAAAATLSWAACGDSNTETTSTDSTANSTTSTTGNPEGGGTSASASFDESASYVDLKTNKPVRLKRNEGSSYLYDQETNQPYSYFFYNPATNDTFDRSGNVVNSYLIRGRDGSYTLDEERWRMKVDDDGDVKIKDHDDTKIKLDASSGDTKIKTDDTTIKR